MDINLFQLIQTPAVQALVFLVLTPMLIFIVRPKQADKAWSMAAYTFAAFILVNAVLVWGVESPWWYFLYSIGVAVAYIFIVAVMMRGLIKLLHLKNSEESAMAFLIVIYQPVALLVVMLAKWAVTTFFLN